MAKKRKRKAPDDAKVRTAKFVALAAWAVPATSLIDLIKFIIKRLF
ncbi:hypothetical protein PQ472_05305 [Lacticaseibacillus pabuli]|uniref:Uncharacterized protein n=1 Tax=Lacticaseibacillus pabuli TaxID=3025672 RepID=A0ABY7WU25_9LACO|nr:hypothetical protein [Lacticaseibacillus sp. KACC 23028]WDF83655.1 hypothetical protein PQ472_05305 [Lacticaseibacillus sp. KACC 23028]